MKRLKAKELLKEVVEYYEGSGKYNFSHLQAPYREQESFDVWMNLLQDIKECIKYKK